MDIPRDHATGDVMANEAERAHYIESVARHAAMVHLRLMDADSVIHANNLDREFTRVFGQTYQDAMVFVIAHPPNSASSGSNDPEDDGENENDLYASG